MSIDSLEAQLETQLARDDEYSGLCWECGVEIDTNRQRQECVFCLACASVDLEKEVK